MKRTIKVCSLIISTTCILLSNSLAFSQTDPTYQAPRTIDGQPDLQGVWANNTITPVERHDVFGDKKFLTDEDLEFLNKRVAELANQPGDALFGNNILIAAFTGEIRPGEAATGSYDQQWMAARRVHRRTSQIIDPPDGKYPPRTEEAIASSRERTTYRREHPADSWLTVRSANDASVSVRHFWVPATTATGRSCNRRTTSSSTKRWCMMPVLYLWWTDLHWIRTPPCGTATPVGIGKMMRW